MKFETKSQLQRPVEPHLTVVHDDQYCGRLNSRRPRQTNDCTVRAVAAAFDLDYDWVYDLLKDNGRACSRGFNICEWISANCKTHGNRMLGRTVEKISFPAVKGESRMNVAKFAKTFNEGTYIVRVSKHVACIRDGVYLDWLNDGVYGYKCVYKAYRISK